MITKEQWVKAQRLPFGIPEVTTVKQQHVNTHEGVDLYHLFGNNPCKFHHGGNIQYRAAWERVSPQRRETYEKILAFFYDSPGPLSPKEVCKLMGKHPSDLSGRFTELKEMDILHPIDETFEGSRRLELVSRLRPSLLAEIVELGRPATEQTRKILPGHDNCDGLCCTTGLFLKTFGKKSNLTPTASEGWTRCVWFV
jgi:hypothetical protein